MAGLGTGANYGIGGMGGLGTSGVGGVGGIHAGYSPAMKGEVNASAVLGHGAGGFGPAYSNVGPAYANAAPIYGAGPAKATNYTGMVLVLFILLVIISRYRF